MGWKKAPFFVHSSWLRHYPQSIQESPSYPFYGWSGKPIDPPVPLYLPLFLVHIPMPLNKITCWLGIPIDTVSTFC